ncbi:MAG: IPT/TIG domain-containing protein [Planctomycetota bacterium]
MRFLAIALPTIVLAISPGCSGGSSSNGGAVVITAPAALNSVSPSSGVVDGGTVVTLNGANFDAATEVSFGGSAAERVTVLSSLLATAVTPRGSAGSVAVAVRNSTGGGATLANGFTYTTTPAGAEIGDVQPASGPLSGGATVTIRGWNLSGTTTVQFGTNSATAVTATTPTGVYPAAITCTVPAGSAGDTDVAVTNTDGSRGVLVNGYHYLAGPAITSLTAGALDPAGGTPVLITGSGFNAPSGVQFGATAATATVALTSQQVMAWAPAGSAGATVSVTVTNPDGQSAVLSGAVTYATGVTSPTVSAISAASGPAAGGASITLTGTGFASGAAVWIGAGLCTSVTVIGPTQITATSPRVPAATNGTQNVVVVNGDGGTGTLASAFTYDAMTLAAPAGTVTAPDIAEDGSGTLHAVWHTPTGVGTNSDVWYSRSTDGGQTWTTAANPNSGCG